MKIAVFIPYHHNLYDTLRTLQKHHDVMLYSPERVRAIPQDIHHTIVPIRVFSQTTGATYHLSALWKHITKETDLVLVKHVLSLTNLFVYLFCKLKKTRYAIMIQQFHTPKGWQKPFFWLITKAIGKNTPLLATTQQGKQQAEHYFAHVHYLPACIDPTPYNVSKKHTGKTLRLLCVSKYQKRKQLPFLLRVLAQLKQTYPETDFELTIIGTAFTTGKVSKHNLKEQKVYGEVQQLVTELSLEKNVTLLQNVPHKDMPKHYTQADLFVFPATSEPLGYALVEAMAAGLPIVASDEVGAADYVLPGKNGYVFPAQDEQACKQAISSFLNKGTPDADVLFRFGKESRARIEKHHTPASFIKQFQNIFR